MNQQSAIAFQIIEQCAGTSSRIEKINILKANDHLEVLKKAIEYAYSPFKMYGIKQIDPLVHSNAAFTQPFHEGTWELLDNLASGKLSGHEAQGAVASALSSHDESSAALLRRIILKDLRAGFSDGTANKVWPGLIPEFPYMRCCLPDKSNIKKWNWAAGVYSQLKADGMFASINVDKWGDLTILSRQGTMFPTKCFGDMMIVMARSEFRGFQYHGELLVFREGSKDPLPREIANGMLNSVAQGGDLESGHYIAYQAWDRIPTEAVKPKGSYLVPYKIRLDGLLEAFTPYAGNLYAAVVPYRIVRSYAEAMEHSSQLLKDGKEGSVLKSPDAIWKDGTSKDQVKLKLEVDVELKVAGFVEGEGKCENSLGALICQSECGQLVVNVNGRTDAMRDEVWQNKLDWIGAVVSVRANAIMKPGESSDKHSLFLPRFIELRKDKTKADDLDQIKHQFENAINA